MSELDVVLKEVQIVAKEVDGLDTRQAQTDKEVKQIIGSLGDISATQVAMLKSLQDLKLEGRADTEDIRGQLRGIYSKRDEDLQKAKPNYIALGGALVVVLGGMLTFLMYFANLMVGPLQSNQLQVRESLTDHLAETRNYRERIQNRLQEGNLHMGGVNKQLIYGEKMQDWIFKEVVAMKSNRYTKEDEAESMKLLLQLIDAKETKTTK